MHYNVCKVDERTPDMPRGQSSDPTWPNQQISWILLIAVQFFLSTYQHTLPGPAASIPVSKLQTSMKRSKNREIPHDSPVPPFTSTRTVHCKLILTQNHIKQYIWLNDQTQWMKHIAKTIRKHMSSKGITRSDVWRFQNEKWTTLNIDENTWQKHQRPVPTSNLVKLHWMDQVEWFFEYIFVSFYDLPIQTCAHANPAGCKSPGPNNERVLKIQKVQVTVKICNRTFGTMIELQTKTSFYLAMQFLLGIFIYYQPFLLLVCWRDRFLIQLWLYDVVG